MAKKKKQSEHPDIIVRTIDTLMPEILKKALLISIGGVLLTEEAIRKILGELRLSKEIVSSVILQSNKAKDEIVRIMSKEIRSLITKANIDQEIRRILHDVKVRIQMEIDFESKRPGESSISIHPKIRKKTKKEPESADKKLR
jgi:hypothetical protein